MGRNRYKIYSEETPYFVTTSIVNWVPLLSNEQYCKIILDAILFLQDRRGISLFAYVIMRDHIHCIASGQDLGEKLRLFKSYTARQILDVLKAQKDRNVLKIFNTENDNGRNEYQLWQEGFYPKQLLGDDMMLQKIDYIHNNPVRAGYVDRPEDWPYSSIHNYTGGKCLIPVCRYSR